MASRQSGGSQQQQHQQVSDAPSQTATHAASASTVCSNHVPAHRVCRVPYQTDQQATQAGNTQNQNSQIPAGTNAPASHNDEEGELPELAEPGSDDTLLEHYDWNRNANGGPH